MLNIETQPHSEITVELQRRDIYNLVIHQIPIKTENLEIFTEFGKFDYFPSDYILSWNWNKEKLLSMETIDLWNLFLEIKKYNDDVEE